MAKAPRSGEPAAQELAALNRLLRISLVPFQLFEVTWVLAAVDDFHLVLTEHAILWLHGAFPTQEPLFRCCSARSAVAGL